MARTMLNDDSMEQVVGGAFTFYNTKSGYLKVRVDGPDGQQTTYYCSGEEAFNWVISRTAGSDVSSAVVTQEALAKGLFLTEKPTNP